MSAVLRWLQAQYGDEHGFQIFKIVLDKGLLALVVAAAAALLSFVLEQYKSNLKRSEELSKIRLPIIHDLISHAGVLYDLGEATTLSLDVKFKDFDDWLEVIDSTPLNATDLTLPNIPELLDQTITMEHGESLSVKDFLVKCAASDTVNSVLNQKKFFCYRGHYDQTGFFWMLFLRLREPFGERDLAGGLKKNLFESQCERACFFHLFTRREKYSIIRQINSY